MLDTVGRPGRKPVRPAAARVSSPGVVTPSLSDRIRLFTGDRGRVGRALTVAGACGIAAALVVGIVGWIFAGRATTTLTDTLDPFGRIVNDLADSISASQVLFDRTTEAIESIESATRSLVRATDSVAEVITQTADLAGGDIADSLESAVESLPGLVDTSRVIDRTMRALSFVGVDYNPEVPLDQSLAALQTSLEPIPGQIRDQAVLLEGVNTDLARVADDGRELSSVLLETRLDMADAARILDSAARNAETAAKRFEAVQAEVSTYTTLARTAVVAAAIALIAAASAPLLLGFYLSNSNGQEPTDQAAT